MTQSDKPYRILTEDNSCFQCDKRGEKVFEMLEAMGHKIETSYTKCADCDVTFMTPVDEARYNTNLIKALKESLDQALLRIKELEAENEKLKMKLKAKNLDLIHCQTFLSEAREALKDTKE